MTCGGRRRSEWVWRPTATPMRAFQPRARCVGVVSNPAETIARFQTELEDLRIELQAEKEKANRLMPQVNDHGRFFGHPCVRFETNTVSPSSPRMRPGTFGPTVPNASRMRPMLRIGKQKL